MNRMGAGRDPEEVKINYLHTRSNVARLYLPRKEGGRGLIGIEERARRESKSLHGCLRETTEWMLQAALKEKVIVQEEGFQDRESLSNKYQMKLERRLEGG